MAAAVHLEMIEASDPGDRRKRLSELMVRLRSRQWAGFAVGSALALLVIGPGMGLGAWVNLDQTVLPSVAVPNSLFGLGPEIPRRALFNVVPALFAPIGLSAFVSKCIVVALFGAAVAGIVRWTSDCRTWVSLGCGALYVMSPFVVTRLGVGHLGLVWAMAVLPHALRTWLAPNGRLAATYQFALLAALGGHLAGSAVLLCLPGVVVARGWRRGFPTAAVIGAAQAVWAVPGWAIVSAAGFEQPSSVDFPTRIGGVWAPLRLVAGEGYFNPGAAAAALPPWLSALVGLSLLSAAALGAWSLWSRGSRSVWWGAFTIAAAGFFVSCITLVGWGRSVWSWVTDSGVLNMWREGQRAFLLPWIFVCVGVAFGVEWWATRVSWADLGVGVIPLCLALLLAGPNVWGVGGRLDDVDLPDGWEVARDHIHADPGTTLILPADQYRHQPWADNRVSHQLFGSYVGGDLVVSSDAGSARGGGEIDPRMNAMWTVLLRWGFDPDGELSVFLNAAGIKWVVALDDTDSMSLEPLLDDRGLLLDLDRPGVRLFRTKGVTLAAGRGVPVNAEEIWPGFILLDSDIAAFVARSGAGALRWRLRASPAHAVDRGATCARLRVETIGWRTLA